MGQATAETGAAAVSARGRRDRSRRSSSPSIEQLTADDYSEAQQEAWASAADDEERSASRLAAQLTLIATLQSAPVGFASLKGADHIDLLYVHPSASGRASRRRCSTRWKNSPARRGAQGADGRRQRQRRRLLRQARLCRDPAQHRHHQRRMARQHHDEKDARRTAQRRERIMSRERLYLFDTTLRDGAQTNGVDFTLHDKRLIARPARRSRHRLCRGRLSRRQSDRHRILRHEPEARTRDLHGVRHDAASGPLGLERSRRRDAARRQGGCDLLRRQIVGVSGPRRAGDHQRREPRLDPRQRDGGEGARAARCWSIASTSSTATRRIRRSRCTCAKAAYDSGARWVVLCDTNGGTMPHEVEAIVGEVVKHIPGNHVGIHAHNDTEQAVAGVVRRGARRRAADPGHAERARRALRQRQSGVDDPDAEAEEGIRRQVRDRRAPTTSWRRWCRCRARSTTSSTARPIRTRLTSAAAPSSPRPAFTPRR